MIIMFNYVQKERPSLKLKRNFITFLYTIFFAVIIGVQLFQTCRNSVFMLPNRYIISGIIVFGVIIFLLIAFLLKEKNHLAFFENNTKFCIISECFIVTSCLVLLFFINIEHIMQAICHTTLLFSFYMTGRLLYGRLNGIVTIVISLMMMLSSITLNNKQAISLLCLVVPFMIFLLINHFAVKKNSFFIIVSYLLLSLVFAIAIVINPLAILVFTGCILSLIFAKTENTSIFTEKGIIYSALLAILTGAFLTAGYFFLPELVHIPSWKADAMLNLRSISSINFAYTLTKMSKILPASLIMPSIYIVQIILLIFSLAAAYYCIRKKFSYIGPFLFSYLGIMLYYLLFSDTDNVIYYFNCLLPVLAAYGCTNTLLNEIPVKTPAASPKEEPVDDIPVSNETTDSKENTINNTEQEITFSEPEINENEIPEWKISSEYIENTDTNEPDISQDIREDHTEDSATVLPVISETASPVIGMETEEPSYDQIDIDNVSNDEEPINSISLDDGNGFLEFTDHDDDMLVNHEDQNSEDEQLDQLLDRLEISDHIKRMNESAQEDMADVIERDEEQVELDEALPLKPSKSTLPKYKKPNFDFKLEPVSIPLDDNFSNISEYDEVPTIRDLESRWKSEEGDVVETVEIESEEPDPQQPIHSEEIVKRTGASKRSYHRITIR